MEFFCPLNNPWAFILAVTALLVILRLLGVIYFSWWLVLLPLLFCCGIVLFLILAVVTGFVVYQGIKKYKGDPLF